MKSAGTADPSLAAEVIPDMVTVTDDCARMTAKPERPLPALPEEAKPEDPEPRRSGHAVSTPV